MEKKAEHETMRQVGLLGCTVGWSKLTDYFEFSFLFLPPSFISLIFSEVTGFGRNLSRLWGPVAGILIELGEVLRTSCARDTMYCGVGDVAQLPVWMLAYV